MSKETITTPDDEKPMMVFRQKKNGGWVDLETVERRNELQEKREQLRQKAKDTL